MTTPRVTELAVPRQPTTPDPFIGEHPKRAMMLGLACKPTTEPRR